MVRFLSMISQAFVFWLPLVLAVMMAIVAMWKGNVGMGVLAVVIALIAGLYRFVTAGALKVHEELPEFVGPPLPPRVVRGRDGRLYGLWSGWSPDGTMHMNGLVPFKGRDD